MNITDGFVQLQAPVNSWTFWFLRAKLDDRFLVSESIEFHWDLKVRIGESLMSSVHMWVVQSPTVRNIFGSWGCRWRVLTGPKWASNWYMILSAAIRARRLQLKTNPEWPFTSLKDLFFFLQICYKYKTEVPCWVPTRNLLGMEGSYSMQIADNALSGFCSGSR